MLLLVNNKAELNLECPLLAGISYQLSEASNQRCVNLAGHARKWSKLLSRLGTSPNFNISNTCSSLFIYFSPSEEGDSLYQVMLCGLTHQKLLNISDSGGCVLQTVPTLWGITQRRVSKQGGQYHSDRHRRSSLVGGSCKLNSFVFCKGIEKCE